MADGDAPVKIEVNGTELTVTYDSDLDLVTITKVVGRDRVGKRDITSSCVFKLQGDALRVVDQLSRASKLKTTGCKCQYGLGWSGHADYCQSIYIAQCSDGYYGDD